MDLRHYQREGTSSEKVIGHQGVTCHEVGKNNQEMHVEDVRDFSLVQEICTQGINKFFKMSASSKTEAGEGREVHWAPEPETNDLPWAPEGGQVPVALPERRQSIIGSGNSVSFVQSE